MSASSTVADRITDEEISQMVAKSASDHSGISNQAILDEIIDRYEALPAGAEEKADELRSAFLLVLENSPLSLETDRYANFLAQEIGQSDLDKLRWTDPNRVIDYCELLYRFHAPEETAAEQVRRHVRRILKNALAEFEARGEMEKMFQLLQRAPTTQDLMSDAELLRMRNRAYLYEMRRVKRNRRNLYLFLALQLLFILIVFPLLFINAENGAIQETIEEAANTNLPDGQERFHSFSDGVYWSIMTATSVGYGDVTPVTRLGRFIAAVLGVMGVVTTGLLAGLILRWVSPRDIR